MTDFNIAVPVQQEQITQPNTHQPPQNQRNLFKDIAPPPNQPPKNNQQPRPSNIQQNQPQYQNPQQRSQPNCYNYNPPTVQVYQTYDPLFSYSSYVTPYSTYNYGQTRVYRPSYNSLGLGGVYVVNQPYQQYQYPQNPQNRPTQQRQQGPQQQSAQKAKKVKTPEMY